MSNQKIIVIGGSAAGPKAASKYRRLDQNAEVSILQKGSHLSMSSCGYPYYVGGIFHKQSQLFRTPQSFLETKNIIAKTLTEVVEIDRKNKTVVSKNLVDGTTNKQTYTKLFLATGANPIVPKIEGINLQGISTLQSVQDADYLKQIALEQKVKHVLIVGGGLIGIETAEAFHLAGIEVTLVERQTQILPFLDWEIARLVEKHLIEKGTNLIKENAVTAFEGRNGVLEAARLADGTRIEAELAVVAIGVRPNVELARNAGLTIGELGGIVVNEYMQTSDPDIYAAGDCVEVVNQITGKKTLMPMGDAANLQARIAAKNMANGNKTIYKGVVSTAILKAIDLNVGSVGLNETAARNAGFEVVSILQAGGDKPAFMGASNISIKMIADKKTRQLIGMQAVGEGDVAKRIAIGAMAITNKMVVDDLTSLDLPYAPPYSPAIDNFITAAHVLENKLEGIMDSISPIELKRKLDNGEKPFLLDVRNPDEYVAMRLGLGETLIPLPKLRTEIARLPKDKATEIVVYCKVSLRGYEASTFIKSLGYSHVIVLEGGLTTWPYDLTSGAETPETAQELIAQ